MPTPLRPLLLAALASFEVAAFSSVPPPAVESLERLLSCTPAGASFRPF